MNIDPEKAKRWYYKRLLPALENVYGKQELIDRGIIKMNELKLEVGKWYRTRNGNKAFVSHKVIDGIEAVCPYGGYVIDHHKHARLWCWFENGTDFSDNDLHEFDLIEEWKEPLKGECWVNVYSTETCVANSTKFRADDQAMKDRIARIKVSWTEGQFDD